MKLKNRKTGEIDDVSIIHSANKIKGVVEHEDGVQCLFAYTLKEFNEEWEDVREEPKEYWYINGYNEPEKVNFGFPIDNIESLREIGFLFETKKETELAIRKFKAWERLKDKGFRFESWDYDGGNYQERIRTGRILFRVKDYEEVKELLDTVFGGEE